MRTTYSIVALLLVSCASFAQSQSALFNKTWGEYYNNAIMYADELPNGDFVLVGGHTPKPPIGFAPDQPQAYMCRMNAKGDILWEKDWGNIYQPDGERKVIKCHDDSYLVVGTGLSGMGGGIGDFEVTNIDADGNIRFHTFYDFYYNDGINDVFETPDSCFIITGTAGLTPTSYFPAFIKIDFTGNVIWKKSQSTFSGWSPYYTAPTQDGGFITLGLEDFSNSFYAKYSADGTMEWIRYPFGTTADTIYNGPSALRINTDGTFDAYYTTAFDVGFRRVNGILQHYDFEGNLLSCREYGNLLYVYLDQDNKTLCGVSNANAYYRMNEDSVFEMKAVLSGEDTLKWVYQYIQTRDGGYLGFGDYTPDPNTTFPTFYVLKIGANGKYIPDEFLNTITAYPNPSTDGNVTLSFDMLTDETVSIRILSSDGRLVYTDEIFCPANSHTELPLRLDEHATAEGLYILETRTSGEFRRQKLIVMCGN